MGSSDSAAACTLSDACQPERPPIVLIEQFARVSALRSDPERPTPGPVRAGPVRPNRDFIDQQLSMLAESTRRHDAIKLLPLRCSWLGSKVAWVRDSMVVSSELFRI